MLNLNAQNSNGLEFLKKPSVQPVVFSSRFVLRFGIEAKRDSFYSGRLNHAMAFAAKAHQGQFRKGSGAPYLAHLMGVASNVMRFADLAEGQKYLEEGVRLPNGDVVNITLEDAVIAALLHDAIEDQGGDSMKLKIRAKFDEEGFPPVVAMLVDYCTTYEQEDLSYNEYKRAYLERIADPSTPATALLISASDKLDNMRDMEREYREEGEAVFWTKFKVTKEQKLEYNRDIVRIFKASGKYPKLVGEIERLQQTIEKRAYASETPLSPLKEALKRNRLSFFVNKTTQKLFNLLQNKKS